jgi:glucan biosynthesis protein C
MKNSANTPARLYYLDWLRVLAMVGIFLFHNARFYDVFSDWHVKNATTNLGASALVAFMGEWLMPLFFLIAGSATYHALKSRRPGQYVQERALRILVPLIFGTVVIVAPQAYFEALSHGAQFGEYNFFQIYWLFLQTLPTLPWYHLWFLAYLFVFSMITLLILVTWREGGTSIISRFALLNRPWVILALLVLLLVVIDVLFYPAGFWGNRGQGNWSIVAYLLFFISGYLIFANPRIMETVKKLRWILLGIAIVASALLVSVFLEVLMDREAHFGSAMFIASQCVQAVSTWCWLLAILGLGSRFLNRNNRSLSYANEAVLPFYILHQTIIITIGFYVVQWNTGVGLKYLTISTTSFIAIMLIYELLVRRIKGLRFLFGMRLRRR